MWDVDFMHPIDPGMAAISDLVAHLVQQTALGLLLNPLGRTDKELLSERLPPPMHAGARMRGAPGRVASSVHAATRGQHAWLTDSPRRHALHACFLLVAATTQATGRQRT